MGKKVHFLSVNDHSYNNGKERVWCINADLIGHLRAS